MIILLPLMVSGNRNLERAQLGGSGSGFMWLQSDSGWSWKSRGWRSWGLGGYLSFSSQRLEASPCDLSYTLVWASSGGRSLERAIVSCWVPQEVDSEMEIAFRTFIGGMILDSISVEERRRKQDEAVGESEWQCRPMGVLWSIDE